MKLTRVNYQIEGSSKTYVAYFTGGVWLPGYKIVSESIEEIELNEEHYFDNDGQLRRHELSSAEPKKNVKSLYRRIRDEAVSIENYSRPVPTSWEQRYHRLKWILEVRYGH